MSGKTVNKDVSRHGWTGTEKVWTAGWYQSEKRDYQVLLLVFYSHVIHL